MENEIIMVGRSTVIIDYSYVNSRTPEQEKIDDQMFREAVWRICKPEMEEAG